MHHGQGELDLRLGEQDSRQAVVRGQHSRALVDAIAGAWRRLGFDVIGDYAFFQLVLAGLVEPTSKPDSMRVFDRAGAQACACQPVHGNVAAQQEGDPLNLCDSGE